MGTQKKEEQKIAPVDNIKIFLDSLLSLKSDILGYQEQAKQELFAILEKRFSSIELGFQALQQEIADIKAEIQQTRQTAQPTQPTAQTTPVATQPKPYQGKRQPAAKKLEISIDRDGNKIYSCFASPMQLLVDQINSGLAVLIESNAKILVYQCQNYIAKRFTNQSNFFVVCSQDLTVLEQFNNHKEFGWIATDKTTQPETSYPLPCSTVATPVTTQQTAQTTQQTAVAMPMPNLMQKRLSKASQPPQVPPPEQAPPF